MDESSVAAEAHPVEDQHLAEHPVRLVVADDLHRNRLTVFFRLILVIPHLVWLFVWSVGVVFVSIVNWLATLATGTPPASLHRFMCSYIRYVVHVDSYFGLVANPYPAFSGAVGNYPIEVDLPEPAAQSRWKTLFRVVLAVPVILLSAVLGGFGTVGYSRGGPAGSGPRGSGGLLGVTVSVLGWFASVVRGRMPKGLRDTGAYSIGYTAQMLAYLLLVTDRYPNSDPTVLLASVDRPPEHPVHLVGDPHDLRRSRVTVFFRGLLALPHFFWLALWSVLMVLVAIANWFATLVRGRPAGRLHALTVRYIRYQLHVGAFLYLAANPFPGFTGLPGTYPLDLELPGPGRQNRWRTAFRLLLVLPAAIVNGALGWGLGVAAIGTWFVALARGSAPWGLRNFSAYGLRYGAQVYAYLLLVTDVYPHASPLEGAPTPEHLFDDVA